MQSCGPIPVCSGNMLIIVTAGNPRDGVQTSGGPVLAGGAGGSGRSREGRHRVREHVHARPAAAPAQVRTP